MCVAFLCSMCLFFYFCVSGVGRRGRVGAVVGLVYHFRIRVLISSGRLRSGRTGFRV